MPETSNWKADYSMAEWFREALKRNHYISDVFLGYRRTPHFIVAVKKKHGRDEWILRATIDFMAFNSLVENIRIGKTGSALIINNAGEFQTRPRIDPPLDLISLIARTSWPRASASDSAPHVDSASMQSPPQSLRPRSGPGSFGTINAPVR